MPEIAGERVDASGSRADATGMGKGLRRASGLDRRANHPCRSFIDGGCGLVGCLDGARCL
jgi:hypothetical protein